MLQSHTPEELAAARERRAEIARANGRKSQGPKTEAGKSVSRLNRLTHGRRTQCIDQSLCLNIVLLEGEDRSLYVRLYDERCAALGPRNQVEKDLCARITNLHWLLNRLQATSTAALEDRLQMMPEVHLPGVSDAALGQFQAFRAYETLAVHSAALLRSLRADIAAHERSLRTAYFEFAQLRKLSPICSGPVPVYSELEVAQAIYSTGAAPEDAPDCPPGEEIDGETSVPTGDQTDDRTGDQTRSLLPGCSSVNRSVPFGRNLKASSCRNTPNRFSPGQNFVAQLRRYPNSRNPPPLLPQTSFKPLSQNRI